MTVINRTNQIKLSDHQSLEDILAFNKNTEGKILEIRNKFGMLMGLGTSIKSFQDLKDKKGNNLYDVQRKRELRYDHINEWVTQDAVIREYQPKEFHYLEKNPKMKQACENSEKFWAENLEAYKKSNSGAKDLPDMLIIGF
jgi:hypothetical protein